LDRETFSKHNSRSSEINIRSKMKATILMLALFILSIKPLSATGTFCAVTEKTSDGFVSVREGPGTIYKSSGRLSQSDLLWVATEQCRSDFGVSLCDETRTWAFVERVFSLSSTLRSNLKGWVRNKLIRQVGCEDDR
jgi:isocitrate lyase